MLYGELTLGLTPENRFLGSSFTGTLLPLSYG